MVRLVPELTGRGLAVSAMQQAGRDFDIDRPGKDSYLHRAAGAREVMATSARRWTLMHEHHDGSALAIDDLIPHLTPVDLLLVEGFDDHPHDKLAVHRAAGGGPLPRGDDPFIVAVASDEPLSEAGLPVFDLEDVPAIAEFIIGHCRLKAAGQGRDKERSES